ncbi:YesL family protein [Niallia sp. 01092]|uniref:YesL family protein n=1 Tax=unclassified Niallia TaxID=2837522 RepID=UPI003FD5AE8C
MNRSHLSNNMIKRLYIILKLTGIWWLFNAPYVFLGVNLLAAPDVASVHTIVIIGIVLLPFVAIPATVAALAIARRYVKGDDSFPFFKAFWNYYKREYVKSMVLGCLNAIVLIVFYLALRYYAALSSPLAIVFYVLVILTPFFFLYVYSFLVDQELPLKAYLYNTIFLLLMHPLNTILMILNVLVAAYILWVVLPPLLIFILPGLSVLIVTYFYQKSMGLEIKKQEIRL